MYSKIRHNFRELKQYRHQIERAKKGAGSYKRRNKKLMEELELIDEQFEDEDYGGEDRR